MYIIHVKLLLNIGNSDNIDVKYDIYQIDQLSFNFQELMRKPD